jgi:hypothetical protein
MNLRSIIAILFLAANISASPINKVLRAMVPVTALATTAYTARDVYDAYDAKREYLKLRAQNDERKFILFDEKKQEYLREYFRPLYQSNKPLYFGVEDNGTHGSAHNYPDKNYVFFQWDFLPQRKTPNEVTYYEQNEDESAESFEERVDIEHRKKLQDFYNQLTIEELSESIEKHKALAGHEIGHLVLNHSPKSDDHEVNLTAGLTSMQGLFNGVITINALTKNASKVGLISRMGLMAALVPMTQFFAFYQKQALSRKHEIEADDYGLAHCTTIAQLEKEKQRWQTQIQNELDQKKRFKERGTTDTTLFLYGLFTKYLNTHPTYQERLERVEKAIRDFKK